MSMDKDAFWALIDSVNREVDSADQKGILRVTQEKLLALNPEEITMWGNIQYYYKDLADTSGVFAAACCLNDFMSDDGFTDFRMWLISRGKEVYLAALRDPDTLAGLNISEDTRFELYGYVSQGAYKKAGFAGDPWGAMARSPLTPEQEEGIRAEIEYFPHHVHDIKIKALLPNLYEKYAAPHQVHFTYQQG